MAGTKFNSPMCIPYRSSIYVSSYPKGKASHFVKESPARDEKRTQQIPGGYYIVIDQVIEKDGDKWGVINPMSQYQLNISPEKRFICLEFGSNILLKKIHGPE